MYTITLMNIESNFDNYDIKSRGEKNYKNIRKKKCVFKTEYYSKPKVGNSLSTAPSSVAGVAISKRLTNKLLEKETAHHITIDHHQITGSRLYNNTGIQTIEPYYKTRHPNHNQSVLKKEKNLALIKKYNFHTKKINDISKDRIVKLDVLGDNIFLGDSAIIKNIHLLKEYEITLIINFGELDRNCDYNINFPDSKSIGYHKFNDILEQTQDIILSNPEKNVLLICDRGVNRSVSIAMGLMIKGLKQPQTSISDQIIYDDDIFPTQMNFNQAFDYMENLKIKVCAEWNNLTNFHLRNLLRVLADRIEKMC